LLYNGPLLCGFNVPFKGLRKERSWIDPDFWERSLTKRFVAARALSLIVIKENFDPSSFSHVTVVFVSKQTVILLGVLFVLKCSFCNFFLFVVEICSLTVYK